MSNKKKKNQRKSANAKGKKKGKHSGKQRQARQKHGNNQRNQQAVNTGKYIAGIESILREKGIEQGTDNDTSDITALVNTVKNGYQSKAKDKVRRLNEALRSTTELVGIVIDSDSQATVKQMNALVEESLKNEAIDNYTQYANHFSSLKEIINNIGNRSTVENITALIKQIKELDRNTSMSDIDELIQKMLQFDSGDVGKLKILLESVGKPSSIQTIQKLLNKVTGQWSDTPIDKVNELIKTAKEFAANTNIDIANELATLVDNVGNKLSMDQTIALVRQINEEWKDTGTSLKDVQNLVKAAFRSTQTPATAIFPELKKLLETIGNRSNVKETALMIKEVYDQQPDTLIEDIDGLVKEGLKSEPNKSNKTISGELRKLVKSVGKQMSISNSKKLIKAINTRYENTPIEEVNDLVKPAFESGAATLENLSALLIRTSTRGSTFQQMVDLVKDAISNGPKDITIQQINNLIYEVPAVDNPPSVSLRNLLNAIGKYGTVNSIQELIQSARDEIGTINNDNLIALLKRNSKGRVADTPDRVVAFLKALLVDPDAGISKLDRFNLIQPKILFFTGRAANGGRPTTPPNHPEIRKSRNGKTFKTTQDRYDHFYMRHSYKHFNFGDIKDSNGMWANGTDIHSKLGSALDDTMVVNLAANVGAYFSEQNPQVKIGVQSGWNGDTTPNSYTITQFFPRSTADENFSMSELNAINNLK